MTDHQEMAAAYEQLYSAAARMLWSQGYPAWRPGYEDEQVGWPQERSTPWRALEAFMLSGDAEGPRAGEPSDPARHLVSRRAPGGEDRPLGFQEALADWTTRLDADPGYLEDYNLRPGACVIIPSARHWIAVFALRELAFRMAPGRPPVTIGADAARLSALAHEAADALRAPLAAPAPAPYPPGAAPWIAPASRRVSDVPDLRARLKELRGAAWRAAEVIPSPEELKASTDFSLVMETAVAASDVLALLGGRPAPVWRDDPEGIDPSRHLAWGSSVTDGQGQPKSFAEEADYWARTFTETPPPWTPAEYQRPPDRDRGETDVVLSTTRAVVLAELLDELAARLRPGLYSDVIHYSAYDLVHFIDQRFRRELGAHVGL
ncbi:hypothetical protein ABT173_09370 [Streptomyces sp. NPDC001795]|uniref:hypothetical protein n=1 Tax=unclassified Streptomyces TaxID=2593676 RepID=UPI0033173EE5